MLFLKKKTSFLFSRSQAYFYKLQKCHPLKPPFSARCKTLISAAATEGVVGVGGQGAPGFPNSFQDFLSLYKQMI